MNISISKTIAQAKNVTARAAKLTDSELLRVTDKRRRNFAKKISKKGYILGTASEVRKMYGNSVFGIKYLPSVFNNQKIYMWVFEARKITQSKYRIQLMPYYEFTSGRKPNLK